MLPEFNHDPRLHVNSFTPTSLIFFALRNPVFPHFHSIAPLLRVILISAGHSFASYSGGGSLTCAAGSHERFLQFTNSGEHPRSSIAVRLIEAASNSCPLRK